MLHGRPSACHPASPSPPPPTPPAVCLPARCTKDVINKGHTLMRAVSKSIHLRQEQIARASFDRQAPSRVGDLRRRHEEILKKQGGVKELVGGHMDALLTEAKVGVFLPWLPSLFILSCSFFWGACGIGLLAS